MPIIEIDETGDRIAVYDTLWSEAPLVKQIPGKSWDRKRKVWTLPLSWAACVQARGVFGDKLQVGAELGAWARDERDRRARVVALRNAQEPIEGFVPSEDNDHDTLLYPFQIPGRDFLVTARNALLGDEMGSGKTLQTLSAIRSIGDAYPALVVCPNSVKRNWAREVEKWLPEATPLVIHGNATQRRKQLEAVKDVDRAIVIMNIESIRLHSRLSGYGSIRLQRCAECDPKEGNSELSASKCEVHPKELNKIDFKVCVLDEGHRVKDPKAKQSRAIWSVFHAPSVEYRWALTGTPVANSPADVWSILHTIAPHEFPAKSAFIDRYALTEFNAFGGMSVVGLKPEMKEEFYSLLDARFRRMIKASVLRQLPDKTRVVRTVEMSPKQAKAYQSMADNYVTVDENGNQLVASSNLAAATRLLQFASASFVVDYCGQEDDPAAWKVQLADPSAKIDELMTIIEDNPGKPLAIAAEHRQLIDLAAQRLTASGIEFGRITGGVDADERQAMVEAFQSGKLDYILFTYKAGGVGLNLTRADTLVRLQRSWSLIDNQQGEDRVHRIGSEVHQKVTIIDVITAGTIEETQVGKLYEKMERLEEIVRDREQLAKLGKPTEQLDAELARIETSDLLSG